MWQHNCDYYGSDIYSVPGIPDVCGDLCADEEKCTHWTWTYFNGGTCWLKNGDTATISTYWGGGCGYVIDRFSCSDSDETDQADQSAQQNAEQNAEQNADQNADQNAEQNADQTGQASQDDQASQASQTPASSQASGSMSFDNGLTSAETAEMLASINSYRAQYGLSALTIDARLVAAANVHSKDMASACTMQHEGTDGSDPWDRMEAQGYDWTVAAENVAAGQTSVSAVMTSWWNSAGHRANILKDDVENVGFALASTSACTYKTYWTQDFGAL
ncbi:SCP-like extracellular protein [Phytophthora palmivora]|uniref:SCP-like extracellular protein n=1 Tax=Phytophthora palmivora TaxID=4796 RepID=A0A2P4X3D0_9STRA|nr:SCP-like extracellular protein [Phytophthora palmivora]